MDWVHCNSCAIRINQGKLFFSACGHVFCQNCIGRAKEKKCHVCKKPLNVTEIGKNMPPELLCLFKDPRQMAAEDAAELKGIVAFQARQREIFVKFRNLHAKKGADSFNEARKKNAEVAAAIEKRKKALSADSEQLKAAKEKKKELIDRIRQLESARHSKHPSRSKTEPMPFKMPHNRPPTVRRRVSSHENPLDLFNESTSKIVTSTPLINMDHRRREHRNQLFGDGLDHPSPIPRS